MESSGRQELLNFLKELVRKMEEGELGRLHAVSIIAKFEDAESDGSVALPSAMIGCVDCLRTNMLSSIAKITSMEADGQFSHDHPDGRIH
jgi:hypothetical protein